jgi:hypothetical protein
MMQSCFAVIFGFKSYIENLAAIGLRGFEVGHPPKYQVKSIADLTALLSLHPFKDNPFRPGFYRTFILGAELRHA